MEGSRGTAMLARDRTQNFRCGLHKAKKPGGRLCTRPAYWTELAIASRR
jgi:hypothetical protein